MEPEEASAAALVVHWLFTESAWDFGTASGIAAALVMLACGVNPIESKLLVTINQVG